MATVKFTSVPPKTLYQAILSSASTFKLADIEGWDGADLTSADFGTQAFGAFMSADRTILELFEWDPSTIASASITILYRGLKFDGTQTTEVAGNKRDWAAGTTVMIGSDIPQLLELLTDIISDQTIGGVKTFSSIPLTTGGDATMDNQLVRYAQALAMLTGSATVSKIVGAGTAGETVTAGQLVYLKASDGRWWLADADTAATVENINLGIAQGAGTAGNAVTNGVLTYGLDANQTGLTGNTVYYASNTAGGISSTPGTTEVTVGYALSTTTIFFNPRFNQQITEDQQDALVGNNTDIAVSTGNKYVTQTGLQHNAEKYAADAEASDTYVITLSPAPTSYTNGMVVYFKANTANTGAATINVNSLGAKTIVKGVNTTLADNDIGAGMFCTLIYDGTNFVLQNPVSTFISQSFAGLFKNGTDSRAANAASGTQNIAHGLGVIPKKIKITTQITAGSGANVIHSQTIGVYDGTTTSMLWWEYNTTNATNREDGGTDTTNIIYTQTNGDVEQVATVTFDATNIILAWTRTADAAGTIQIMWEAEA